MQLQNVAFAGNFDLRLLVINSISSPSHYLHRVALKLLC